MNKATIIITMIFSIITLFKLYFLFKNGIKKSLKRKLVMLLVVAPMLGIFMFLNPEYKILNPKDMFKDFVSLVIEKSDI